MRFYIIGDKDTVMAFSLLGIEGAVVDLRIDILNALHRAIKNREIGIILITEILAERIKDVLNDILIKKKCHLILQIPDINGPIPGKYSVEDFAYSALGMKIHRGEY